MAAAHGLARSGWALTDIRAPNFILTGGPDSWTVVIIDLYGAAPLSTKNLDLQATIMARTFWIMIASYSQEDLGELCDAFSEWGMKDETVQGLAWPDEGQLETSEAEVDSD